MATVFCAGDEHASERHAATRDHRRLLIISKSAAGVAGRRSSFSPRRSRPWASDAAKHRGPPFRECLKTLAHVFASADANPFGIDFHAQLRGKRIREVIERS